MVQAGCSAGMAVVGVPSTIDIGAYDGCTCTFLPSLLQFQPQDFGLPPFEDRIADTVPLDVVWRLKGPVVKGFGRGSRVRPPPHLRTPLPRNRRGFHAAARACRNWEFPLRT